jgi:hypothetical protein
MFSAEDARRIAAAQPDVAFEAAVAEIDQHLLCHTRSGSWPMEYTLWTIQVSDDGPTVRWLSAALVDSVAERLADAYRAAGWQCGVIVSAEADYPEGTRCIEFQAPEAP